MKRASPLVRVKFWLAVEYSDDAFIDIADFQKRMPVPGETSSDTVIHNPVHAFERVSCGIQADDFFILFERQVDLRESP